MKDLHNKVAVITGAGNGIGRALALELARQGCRLALSDLKLPAAVATADACRRLGVEARAYGLDVAQREAMQAHADEVIKDFGKVHLVINNAGVLLLASAREMSWKNFEWLMNINFWGVMHGSQIFLPHLIASGDGHLVNVSSIAGMVGLPYNTAYNASKFAVRGYTEALGVEMQVEGLPVRISCVHPGVVKTDIFKDARQDNPAQGPGISNRIEKLVEKMMARTTPEKAAEVIVRGIRRNQARIMVGTDAALMEPIQRLLGIRYQGLIGRLTTREVVKASAAS